MTNPICEFVRSALFTWTDMLPPFVKLSCGPCAQNYLAADECSTGVGGCKEGKFEKRRAETVPGTGQHQMRNRGIS